MKNYDAIIMDNSKVKEIIGTDIQFKNGFVYMPTVDWWGKLEKYLNKPIVSVRPSGRENWNEIIILCAKGYIADDKSVLYYEKFEDIISVLHDIFIEADNDEYEVFECYTSTCKASVWSEVEKWVHETY